MNDRKKLIQILTDSFDAQYNQRGLIIPTYTADHLLANGVTVQKHGRWIEQEAPNMDTYYDCSACGESFYLIEGTPVDNIYNYCPNCGAKMEENHGKE